MFKPLLAATTVQSIAIPGQNNANQAADEYAYTCVGTSPFWRLDINYQGIHFIDPLQKTVNMPFNFPLSAESRSASELMVFKTRLNDKPAYIVMRKNIQGCQSGFGNQPMTYDGTLIFSDRVLSGCCAVALPPSKSQLSS